MSSRWSHMAVAKKCADSGNGCEDLVWQRVAQYQRRDSVLAQQHIWWSPPDSRANVESRVSTEPSHAVSKYSYSPSRLHSHALRFYPLVSQKEAHESMNIVFARFSLRANMDNHRTLSLSPLSLSLSLSLAGRPISLYRCQLYAVLSWAVGDATFRDKFKFRCNPVCFL